MAVENHKAYMTRVKSELQADIKTLNHEVMKALGLLQCTYVYSKHADRRRKQRDDLTVCCFSIIQSTSCWTVQVLLHLQWRPKAWLCTLALVVRSQGCQVNRFAYMYFTCIFSCFAWCSALIWSYATQVFTLVMPHVYIYHWKVGNVAMILAVSITQ